MGLIYFIEFSRNARDTWSYGADLSYNSDGSVRYSNQRSGPVQSIQVWRNRMDAGVGPILPILRCSSEYQLLADIDCEPENSLGFTVTFYDESKAEISSEFFQTLSATFTVPEETRSYQIALTNLNNVAFTFHSLLLAQPQDLTDVSVVRGPQNQWLQLSQSGKPQRQSLVLVSGYDTLLNLPIEPAAQTYYWRCNEKTLRHPESLIAFAIKLRQSGALTIVSAGLGTADLAKAVQARL